jgi:hypothetical protein
VQADKWSTHYGGKLFGPTTFAKFFIHPVKQ